MDFDISSCSLTTISVGSVSPIVEKPSQDLAPVVEVVPTRTAPIKINLNDMARIKLTPSGLDVIRAHYQKMVMGGFPQDLADDAIARRQPDAEGYTEMPLHEVMYVFGALLTPFNQNPPLKMSIAIRRMI